MKRIPTLSHTTGRQLFASLAAAVAVSLCTVGHAGELNPAHVPADAKWLIHINQAQLAESEVFKGLRENQPEIMQTLQDRFQAKYGIDTRDDLQSITIFSSDYKLGNGTMLLQTDYDKEKIIAQLRERDTLKETEANGQTLYTYKLAEDAKIETNIDKKGNKTGDRKTADTKTAGKKSGATKSAADSNQNGDKALNTEKLAELREVTVVLRDKMIVVAASPENAQAVLQLLDGKAESLEGKNSPLTAEIPEGAVIHGAAIQLGDLDRYNMLLPLMQQHDQLFYALGQNGNEVYDTVTLTAQSEEVAMKTTEVLQGIIAYETLAASGSQALSAMMQDVQLSRDGTVTYVNWKGDSDTLVNAIGDLTDRVYHWFDLASR